MNKIIVSGRLVDNPTLFIDKTGRSICRFRIAINHGKNKTTFINAVVFRELADKCQKILKKASQVLIEGKLDYHIQDKKEFYSIQIETMDF